MGYNIRKHAEIRSRKTRRPVRKAKKTMEKGKNTSRSLGYPASPNELRRSSPTPKHPERKTKTSTPKVEGAPSPVGFVNHEKEHECPHIAVARGSRTCPKLSLNLQIQHLQSPTARSTARSAIHEPQTPHRLRHLPAHRQPQQASGHSSCKPFPLFPSAQEKTPSWCDQEEETKSTTSSSPRRRTRPDSQAPHLPHITARRRRDEDPEHRNSRRRRRKTTTTTKT